MRPSGLWAVEPPGRSAPNGDTPAGQAVRVARYVLLPRHGLRWRPGQRAPAVAAELATGVEDELRRPRDRRRAGVAPGPPGQGAARGHRRSPGRTRAALPAGPAPAGDRGRATGRSARRSSRRRRGVGRRRAAAAGGDGDGLHGRRSRPGRPRPDARGRHRPAAGGRRRVTGAALRAWRGRTTGRSCAGASRSAGRSAWCSSPSTTPCPTGCACATGRPARPRAAASESAWWTPASHADHPHLVVAGGQNCVTGEDPTDHGSNGHEHGTHVAGIIGGRGRPPGGCRGVAPGADLMSYRVFGRGRAEATNFAIAKAIDTAVGDGCDVVNLSLGGGPADAVVRAAIEEAQEAGVIVVAAAGNDGRGPVAFPADLPGRGGGLGSRAHGHVSTVGGRLGGAPRTVRARRRRFRRRLLQRRRHRPHRARRRHRVHGARRLPGPRRHVDGLPGGHRDHRRASSAGADGCAASPGVPSGPPRCWPGCAGGPGR